MSATTAGRVSMPRAIHAEWMKFSTLPSNAVTLVVAFVLIIGLAIVQIAVQVGDTDATRPITDLLAGVSWAQFPLTILAVVAGCSEWSSGTGKVTFLAVPTRWPVLLGKVSTIGVLTFLVSGLGVLVALAIGAGSGIDVTADPAFTTRLVTGTGLYLATIACLALAIGVMIRNLPASILTAIGFLWITPFIAGMIPLPEVQRLAAYLPVMAGGLLLAHDSPVAELSPWGGYAVLLAWTILALLGAVTTLRTRDI